MDKLVQKIEFDGPSLTITSKNLAVGISAINTSSFPGANFSAFMALNSSDPQVHLSVASTEAPCVMYLTFFMGLNVNLCSLEETWNS